MNFNPDARVIKTKLAIKTAYLNQIEDKGLKSISVSSIVAEAKISRGTFYLHYGDKDDLQMKLQADFIYNLKRAIGFNEAQKRITNFQQLESFLLEYLENYYGYCEANMREMTILFFSDEISRFHNLLKETFKQQLDIGFKNNLDSSFKIPIHYLVALVAGIHTSVTEEWIKTDNRESAKDMAALMFKLLRNIPLAIMADLA